MNLEVEGIGMPFQELVGIGKIPVQNLMSQMFPNYNMVLEG